MEKENSLMLKWQNVSEMQKSFNVSHIKMFKGDALYEDYRAMPNVEIVNEDSEEEYIVFYTINPTLARIWFNSGGANSDWDFVNDGYRMNGLRELTQEAIKEELQEIGGKIAVAIDNAPKAPAVANSISLSKDDKIAGFAVTYLNEYGEDDVEFCDSFEEMLEVQKERESQGHTTKIFIEISDEILQKEKGE